MIVRQMKLGHLLVENTELPVGYEALTEGEEERFEDELLDEAPGGEHVKEYERGYQPVVILEEQDEAPCTGQCDD